MTPKERAAMQQALEALVELVEKFDYEQYTSICELDPAKDTIFILQEALAEQAEQEPVAWALTSENGEVLDCISHTYKVTQPCTVDYAEPLYTHPVRTKDLTDDEIRAVLDKHCGDGLMTIAYAVIAADREKNK